MWFRFRKHSGGITSNPSAIGARCPGCKRELSLFCEQLDLFAAGKPVWVFCPICTRLVSPERFTRARREQAVEDAHTAFIPGSRNGNPETMRHAA
jgi:hypothetical protein